MKHGLVFALVQNQFTFHVALNLLQLLQNILNIFLSCHFHIKYM